jgi:DNA-directed RNA polymerase specialized sigma24 family protein
VTVIADDRWGGDPSQKSYDDIRADDSTIPESHGIDVLQYAKRQRAEAREAVRRARVAENLAKKRTAQIARAGLDAGLSYREAGLRVGIAASTLHNALQAAEES